MIKKISLALAVMIAVSIAYASTALPIRVQFSSAPILSSAYSQLVASTVKGVKAISIAQSGAHSIEIAVGAAGSEVVQVIVAPSSGLVPVVIPMATGYGARISAISLDGSTGSTGELQMNLLYN